MNVQPEVRAIDGYPVVLPCSFSHPRHSQHSSLQVLWRLGHGPDAVILYYCTSTPAAPTCEPGPQQDQRYRLEGNPKEHDLSLRINNAALQDNGRYYCRVEVQGQNRIGFEDKMGTRLRVEGKSRQTKVILSWTVILKKKKMFYGYIITRRTLCYYFLQLLFQLTSVVGSNSARWRRRRCSLIM